MEPKDPFEQAEDIVYEAEQHLAAEITKSHAEMILLTAVADKPLVQASLLFKASGQGIDYLTGILVAIGLSARNWGRVLAGNPDLDLAQYIDPEAEGLCTQGGGFAHHLVRETLLVEDVPGTDQIRQEMKGYYLDHDAMQWGRVMTHTIGLYAELLTSVLDIRNGDYTPGDGDDR